MKASVQLSQSIGAVLFAAVDTVRISPHSHWISRKDIPQKILGEANMNGTLHFLRLRHLQG
jgi:hypothetical protein